MSMYEKVARWYVYNEYPGEEAMEVIKRMEEKKRESMSEVYKVGREWEEDQMPIVGRRIWKTREEIEGLYRKSINPVKTEPKGLLGVVEDDTKLHCPNITAVESMPKI